MPSYSGERVRMVTDVPPVLGLTRTELIDGIAQTYRELSEVQAEIGDRDPTPAQQDVWDELVARYRTYHAAVTAMDAAPLD